MKIKDFVNTYNLTWIQLIISENEKVIIIYKEYTKDIIWKEKYNNIKDKEIKKWEPLNTATFLIEI